MSMQYVVQGATRLVHSEVPVFTVNCAVWVKVLKSTYLDKVSESIQKLNA
jgi:hypothetical protein